MRLRVSQPDLNGKSAQSYGYAGGNQSLECRGCGDVNGDAMTDLIFWRQNTAFPPILITVTAPNRSIRDAALGRLGKFFGIAACPMPNLVR